MRQPNTVLLHTVPHTGTIFTDKLIHSAYKPQQIVTISRAWLNKNGQKLPSSWRAWEDLGIDDFKRVFSQALTTEKINKTKLLFIFCHHVNIQSAMSRSLRGKGLDAKVISPIRDPLLCAISHVSRIFAIGKHHPMAFLGKGKSWKSPEFRTAIASSVSDLLLNVLRYPSKNHFLFPVDLDNSKEELCKEMFNYCGIPVTPATVDLINGWAPVNVTDKQRRFSKAWQLSSDTKKAIQLRDIPKLKRIAKPEMDYLQRREDLKEALVKIGYKNLPWW